MLGLLEEYLLVTLKFYAFDIDPKSRSSASLVAGEVKETGERAREERKAVTDEGRQRRRRESVSDACLLEDKIIGRLLENCVLVLSI